MPIDGNFLLGTIFLPLKSTTYTKINHEARFSIGGHRDNLKNFMVYSSQALQVSFSRLILGLESLRVFSVWTSYVTQAYLQSAVPLSRDLFLH